MDVNCSTLLLFVKANLHKLRPMTDYTSRLKNNSALKICILFQILTLNSLKVNDACSILYGKFNCTEKITGNGLIKLNSHVST